MMMHRCGVMRMSCRWVVDRRSVMRSVVSLMMSTVIPMRRMLRPMGMVAMVVSSTVTSHQADHRHSGNNN